MLQDKEKPIAVRTANIIAARGMPDVIVWSYISLEKLGLVACRNFNKNSR
jgi:hypothetical protein